MARKTEESPIIQEEAVETMETQEAAYDPWQDMRQVFVPKLNRGEQNTLEVGVNDKTYFIPKEVFMLVPAPVWEVLQGMLDSRKAAEEHARRTSGDSEHTMAF